MADTTPQLCGRVIEAGIAGGCKTLDGGGCTFSVVVLWVQPEVAQHLARHIDGEVLLHPLGLPGDQLTTAPPLPRAPGLPPSPPRLSPGEQLVWAASFAHHVDGGAPAAIAARIATHRVQQLRALTTAEVDVLGRVGSRAGAAADIPSLTVCAAVEQMRGGR